MICCTEACHYLLRNLLTIVADEIEPTYRKKGAAVYFNEILKNVLLWKDLPDENVSDDLSAKSKKKRKFDFVKKKSANKLELRRPQLSDQEASSLLNRAVEHPSHFVTIFLKKYVLRLPRWRDRIVSEMYLFLVYWKSENLQWSPLESTKYYNWSTFTAD